MEKEKDTEKCEAIEVNGLNTPANDAMSHSDAAWANSQMSECSMEGLLMSFANRTTAHGVQRLTMGPTPQRIAWLCIILASCVGFSVHLNQLIQQYLTYPVNSAISTEIRDLQFPSVTICSTDIVPNINFDQGIQPPANLNHNLKTPRIVKRIIMGTAMIYHQLRMTNWNASVMSWPNTTFDDGRYAGKTIISGMKDSFQQPYETVLDCRFNSEPCSFANFTVYRDEQMFYCLTFDPPNGTLARTGVSNGLYMVLLGVGDSLLTDDEQASYTAGFRVVLHDRGVKPDLQTASFDAPYGAKTLAKFTVHSFDRVNRPAAPCEDELPAATYTEVYSSATPEGFEHRTYRGWKRDCEWRRMHDEFVAECGCLGSHLPLPRDMMESGLLPCHGHLPKDVFYRNVSVIEPSNDINYYIIQNSTNQYRLLTEYLRENVVAFAGVGEASKCFDRVRYRQNTAGMSSAVASCANRCSVNQYRTFPDRVPWPTNLKLATFMVNRFARKIRAELMARNISSNVIRRVIERTEVIINNPSISVVDLYVDSTKATVTTESTAYVLRNLFSDLGGILGLWIGTSVITVLELMELLGQLIVTGLGAIRVQLKRS